MNDDLNGGPASDTAGEPSLADALRSAWDAHEASAATPATDSAPEPTDTEPAAEPRTDGRDERGRFAAKQQPEAAVADPAVASEAPPAEPAAPQDPAIEAPQHWAAADKERFAKLPRDGQQFLLDRHKAMEGDYTRRMQEIAPLRKSVEQWQPYLQQLGASPEQAFQALIGAEYRLRTGTPDQKLQALQQLAQDYGIPLTQAAPQPQEDRYVDPDVAALRQELADIKAWRTSREQAEMEYQRQQQERQQQTLQSAITSFATAKDEAGAPAHPHFEAVRDKMAALIFSVEGKTDSERLKAAYDMAVYADPSIRQQLLTAQQEAAAKKAAEEAKAKAQQASKAAVSIPGSPVGSATLPPAKSVREELERAWASARA